ncbi:MAG: Undecaprenyl-phosphate 4-deoxy-4-formamido-L-arabinose transferase [Candidatus Woesebacteria bacterium GW2011_GWB1_39_10]|uniref:Undecaprenyl-phosphate 4-deoxy-4-formamido-L-arabinose transferase n=2 Tax=Candidatus Woeseibacteriota TaxID=1752722 RepID=A0A0G0LLB2_9BACT|nr:MAG: Undecaprenyl-phosphate 4-deoxy-4-formamido-L-arabinose transferase [Candidatus Woesebacteria bacterium GW2011_GWB1_39_10]KKS90817.1 MAG: Undecaprenyl-phosphate 4-deoxy-4-formamido-L-arabinose transferase [Candidatus Woesebacteria bacterium GW2011_GWA1_43_12]
MAKVPQISFVIPAKDEEKTILLLHDQIVDEMKKIHKSFEVIFVDDGSTDSTLEIAKKLNRKNKNVKIVKHRGNFGKSIALQSGFEASQGEIIITMDADLQDNPKEIPKFIKKIEEGHDLVSGWKKKRFDPLSKTIPSKMGNWLTRKLTGVKIHDLNCGFKAYRKNVLANIHLYGELYKFIPVLVTHQNFKVTEIVVSHKPRKYGKSKFGMERNIKGVLDLITVVFLTGYIRRPGHFFGFWGMVSFFVGFVIGIYITYLRVVTGTIQDRQPLLILGMLLMIIGIQLISTGLVSEMIVSLNQKDSSTEKYIEEKII